MVATHVPALAFHPALKLLVRKHRKVDAILRGIQFQDVTARKQRLRQRMLCGEVFWLFVARSHEMLSNAQRLQSLPSEKLELP